MKTNSQAKHIFNNIHQSG